MDSDIAIPRRHRAPASPLAFVKREPVFSVAFIAALVSMFFVPPSAAYAGYFNWHLIAVLLCFMLCIAGLKVAGAFESLAHLFLKGRRTVTFVAGVLVGLPYVLSMFITNDVSLLAFVPFTCLVLGAAGRGDLVAPVVVLQTIAANMGSMLMPFGNPHNLYIYESFHAPVGEFLATTGPFTAFSGLLLALCITVLTTGRRRGMVSLEDRSGADAGAGSRTGSDTGTGAGTGTSTTEATQANVRQIVLFAAAFAVCVLCVLGIVPEWAMLIVVCALALAINPRLFAKVDWFLLGTFLCFFVFSGNLATLPAVRETLTGAISAQPFWIPLLTCQVISNVPTAALLSPFTTNWQAILLATDIGGLGTPVGSLASLISLGLYRTMRPEGSAQLGRYMVIFLTLNFAFMGLNCLLYALLF